MGIFSFNVEVGEVIVAAGCNGVFTATRGSKYLRYMGVADVRMGVDAQRLTEPTEVVQPIYQETYGRNLVHAIVMASVMVSHNLFLCSDVATRALKTDSIVMKILTYCYKLDPVAIWSSKLKLVNVVFLRLLKTEKCFQPGNVRKRILANQLQWTVGAPEAPVQVTVVDTALKVTGDDGTEFTTQNFGASIVMKPRNSAPVQFPNYGGQVSSIAVTRFRGDRYVFTADAFGRVKMLVHKSAYQPPTAHFLLAQ